MPTSSQSSKFRPIACCIILYKHIAKNLADSWNQCAFIEGRKIIDNVFLGHEIVKDYDKHKGKPRCAVMDITKSFDSEHCEFLLNTLQAWEFASIFLYLDKGMFDYSSLFYQSLEPVLRWFFDGKTGVRQGGIRYLPTCL